MTNAGSKPDDIFDVKKVRRFIELLKEHDLAEIDLRDGDQRIRIRRGGEPVVTVGSPAPQMMAPAPPSASGGSAAAADEDRNIIVIKSPMVGTFYVAANPDTPAFVKVGDHVGPESTVCIIEAMKVFNEIPAEASGKIVAVLVENGQPVEFGQPLFKLNPKK